MISELIICLVLLLGIPLGFWLAWLCRDELVQGKIWFKIIILLSIIAIVWAYFSSNLPVLFSMIFIIIISLISLIKSHDKKWTKRRI